MSFAANLGFLVAKRLVQGAAPVTQGTDDADTRFAHRDRVLRDNFLDSFDARTIAGKDVLDFGCGGEGGLCYALSDLGVRSITGYDVNVEAINTAQKRSDRIANSRLMPVTPQFHCGATYDSIDLGTNTFDIVICFDVMEHVMSYQSVIPEWSRILRPGGRVLIWWMPYYHPFGHHLKNYIPIPWAHVMLSERDMLAICSRIVRLPEFTPPFWDLDAAGQRIDRFAGVESTDYLNKLTTTEFERICRNSGLTIARREFRPFTGPQVVRWTSKFGGLVPKLRDFLSAAVIYELSVPA